MIKVCADDYGFDDVRSIAIANSFANKYLDSAYIMVNMPYVNEAVAYSEKMQFKDRIGLHLNLTEGKPITKGILNERLFCDSNGFFNSKFRKNILSRFFLRKMTRKRVEDEIVAQINMFLSMGHSFKSINSHHHVHKDYAILRILLPLLKKYNFTSIRIAKNTGKMKLFNKIYNKRINKLILKSGIKPNSAYLFSNLKSALTLYKNGMDAEIEVHPLIIDKIIYDGDCELNAVMSFDGGNKNESI